ncbi:MAG: T9SS C-terminal target domain-containing protein [Calditrichaeota bacterium]|nr:MAG: T9SS C-terminal target domain-containing protein [Calditrichota bacterium]
MILEVPGSQEVSVDLYNILGEKIGFYQTEKLPDRKEIRLKDFKTISVSILYPPDTIPLLDSMLTSGVYFYKVKSDTVEYTKKMLLLK